MAGIEFAADAFHSRNEILSSEVGGLLRANDGLDDGLGRGPRRWQEGGEDAAGDDGGHERLPHLVAMHGTRYLAGGP